MGLSTNMKIECKCGCGRFFSDNRLRPNNNEKMFFSRNCKTRYKKERQKEESFNYCLHQNITRWDAFEAICGDCGEAVFYDKPKGDGGIVYIVYDGRYYKIGKSTVRNFHSRVQMIRNANPDIQVICRWIFLNDCHIDGEKEAFSFESRLHKAFKDKHYKYEWFLLSEWDIDNIHNILMENEHEV